MGDDASSADGPRPMTLWERMEEFLYHWDLAGHKSFTNHDVAHLLKIRPSSASRMIDAYQEAMTKPTLSTLYSIRREGRTASARWFIGHSTKDLRALTGQFADDVETRITGVVAPMMNHITQLNPKAQPQATKTIIRIGRLIQSLAELGK
jgi:hypothetical protein